MDTQDKIVSLRSEWSDLGVYPDETNATNLRYPLLCVYPLTLFIASNINLNQTDLNSGGHMGPHDNDTERFSKTCSSSSKVSSKTQFHSMSPNHLPHVELYHKAGFPFGHKIAASSFWGIYTSSLMSTVRPTMLHNSRVHHSQN